MDVKVSICCVSYNHEAFIAQALDSFLMQQTNFDFEIIIGEDFSKDRTRSILSDYQARYPGKIRLLLREKNIGAMPNFLEVLHVCQGKYIALCEGDDFWTDPYKLQKQFDLMEKRTDLSFCFHQCNVINNQSQIIQTTNTNEDRQEFTLADIIEKDWFIMTCAIFLRKSMLDTPSWLSDVVNGDYSIQLLCALKGNAYLLKETMGVYRKHGGGQSDTLLGMEYGSNMLCKLLDIFDHYTNNQYSAYILKKKLKLQSRLVEEFAYSILKYAPFSRPYRDAYKRIYKYSNIKNALHLKYLIRYALPLGLRQNRIK